MPIVRSSAQQMCRSCSSSIVAGELHRGPDPWGEDRRWCWSCARAGGGTMATSGRVGRGHGQPGAVSHDEPTADSPARSPGDHLERLVQAAATGARRQLAEAERARQKERKRKRPVLSNSQGDLW